MYIMCRLTEQFQPSWL